LRRLGEKAGFDPPAKERRIGQKEKNSVEGVGGKGGQNSSSEK